jgi:hypothetical protein
VIASALGSSWRMQQADWMTDTVFVALQISSSSLRCGIESTIHGEPGSMLGPTREALTLIARDLLTPNLCMFEPALADPSVCVPCAVHAADGSTGGGVVGNKHRCELFWSIGRLLGAALAAGLTFPCQLHPTTLKAILGVVVPSYYALLPEHDPSLAYAYILENDPADLDLTYSIDVLVNGVCPSPPQHHDIIDIDNSASGHASTSGSLPDSGIGESYADDDVVHDGLPDETLPGEAGPSAHNDPSAQHKTTVVSIPLSSKIPSDRAVTRANAAEYVELVSEYNLRTAVQFEMEALRTGLFDVVPEDLLRAHFTPAEFSLLLNGVTELSVPDWRANTTLQGYTAVSPQIEWFWQLVTELNSEEKSLLLQFWTGCTATPAGGFAMLGALNQELSGCIITKGVSSTTALPMSSTCFNQLKLPEYHTAHDLREKVLIAVRHGSGGFSFA